MKSSRVNRKIRNLTIGLIALTILANRTIHLVKGERQALKLVNKHQDSISHFPNIVAHRGFSGMYPDNSYTSVNAALKSNCVDLIEIDIRMTSDSTLVLHHNKVTNADDLKIDIEKLDLSDSMEDIVINDFYPFNLRDINSDDFLFLFKRYLNKINSKDILIKLENFLKWYSFDKKIIFDIKINDINYELMNKLDFLLSKYHDKIYLQSDCYLFLKEMMNLYPEYQYIYIVNSENDLKRMDSNFCGFTIHHSLFDKIQKLDDKMYLVYTINSKEGYKKILNSINYEDDIYIITDNPDYVCSLNKILRK